MGIDQAKNKPDTKIASLAIERSVEIELPALKDQIAKAAYSDFVQLPLADGKDPSRLRSSMHDRLTNLLESHGSSLLKNRSFRILGGQEATAVSDDVGVVLALAAANLELYLMVQSGCSDSTTSTPIGHALRARKVRNGRPLEAFGELRELTNLPDFAQSVLQERLNLDTLLKLRASSAGVAFREWFHQNCVTDTTNTARAYIELLSTIPKTETFAVKVLRFLITTVLGLIPVVGSVTGTIASVVDSFVVGPVVDRTSPKFFVEQLKQLDDTVPAEDA